MLGCINYLLDDYTIKHKVILNLLNYYQFKHQLSKFLNDP